MVIHHVCSAALHKLAPFAGSPCGSAADFVWTEHEQHPLLAIQRAALVHYGVSVGQCSAQQHCIFLQCCSCSILTLLKFSTSLDRRRQLGHVRLCVRCSMQMQAVHHAFSRSSHDAGGCIQGAVLAPEPANAVIWVRIFGGKLDFKKIGTGAGN